MSFTTTFRQRPPEVQAFQFDESCFVNEKEVFAFCNSKPFRDGGKARMTLYGDDRRFLVLPGQWIIKDWTGKKWVETDEQFRKRWEQL